MIETNDDQGYHGCFSRWHYRTLRQKIYKNPLALFFIHTKASSCTEKTFFLFPCLELATPLFHALNYFLSHGRVRDGTSVASYVCLEFPPPPPYEKESSMTVLLAIVGALSNTRLESGCRSALIGRCYRVTKISSITLIPPSCCRHWIVWDRVKMRIQSFILGIPFNSNAQRQGVLWSSIHSSPGLWKMANALILEPCIRCIHFYFLFRSSFYLSKKQQFYFEFLIDCSRSRFWLE